MRRLSDKELEVVFKNGWKPSEYVASRDGQGRSGTVQECDVSEVEIDGRSFMVRPVSPDILK